MFQLAPNTSVIIIKHTVVNIYRFVALNRSTGSIWSFLWCFTRKEGIYMSTCISVCTSRSEKKLSIRFFFQTGSSRPVATRNKEYFSHCHFRNYFYVGYCTFAHKRDSYTLYNKSDLYSVIWGRNWKGYMYHIAF